MVEIVILTRAARDSSRPRLEANAPIGPTLLVAETNLYRVRLGMAEEVLGEHGTSHAANRKEASRALLKIVRNILNRTLDDPPTPAPPPQT